jgi:hypothetical protein
MRFDLTDGDLNISTGVLQQFGTDWTSDRKPVERDGFRIFQHSSAPATIPRDLAERGVFVRDAMDGRRAPRAVVGIHELIFFSFFLLPLFLWIILSFLSCLAVSHPLTRFIIDRSRIARLRTHSFTLFCASLFSSLVVSLPKGVFLPLCIV